MGAKECWRCKPCEVKAVQQGAQKVYDDAEAAVAKAVKDVDKFGRKLDQAGAILDEARAAIVDPSGYIRETIIGGAKDLIGDQLEKVREAPAAGQSRERLLSLPVKACAQTLTPPPTNQPQALGVSNVCNTDAKRAAFRAGGWNAYFGKRLWDSRSVTMLVGSLFPATSAAATREIYSEIKGQSEAMFDMLERAARDAVSWRLGPVERCSCAC